MVKAHVADIKRWLQDHDTDFLNQTPVVQNTWYEVFHAQDVRLLYCVVNQINDETLVKLVEVRWTIDGNVYLIAYNNDNNTLRWINRDHAPSTGGTDGLDGGATARNAAMYVDKRGLDFKVEIRMTGVPGTNQILQCWCVRETLEVT